MLQFKSDLWWRRYGICDCLHSFAILFLFIKVDSLLRVRHSQDKRNFYCSALCLFGITFSTIEVRNVTVSSFQNLYYVKMVFIWLMRFFNMFDYLILMIFTTKATFFSIQKLVIKENWKTINTWKYFYLYFTSLQYLCWGLKNRWSNMVKNLINQKITTFNVWLVHNEWENDSFVQTWKEIC